MTEVRLGTDVRYVGAATEYDDRRGPLRDRVLHNDRRWRTELGRTIEQAVEAGHLAAGDGEQRVFELYAIALAVHHDAGLYGYEPARRHGEAAVDRWFALHTSTDARR